VHIRPARVEEAGALTELAMRSKAHWGYDEAFMAACRDELTIRPEHVPNVDVAELDGAIVGMVRLEPGTIEDLFVEPDVIGTGVGAALFRHVVRRAASEGMRALLVDADPNAEGFYRSMGAVRVGEAPSASIPGRVLPQLEVRVPPPEAVEIEYREWLDLLPLSPGARVLDIGSGSGVPTGRLLVARGCEVLGVDVSDAQVQLARELVPEGRFECADILDWDAEERSFDAVVSFFALVHIDAREQLAARIARWLSPGGHLLVTDPGGTDWSAFDVLRRTPIPDADHELVFAVLPPARAAVTPKPT
jgi:2-polyprenyl-3-methyl-5-hydroxy-6-metoxy-1,4-benzoquinol methylase